MALEDTSVVLPETILSLFLYSTREQDKYGGLAELTFMTSAHRRHQNLFGRV
jgi:hypothetical protein